MSEQNPIQTCPHCGYPVEIAEHAAGCPNAGGRKISEAGGSAMYKRYGSRQVAGESITSIVKEGNRFPFRKELESQIPTFSVVPGEEGMGVSGVSLDKVSQHHGRDLEVGDTRAIWGDEYGTIFGSLNIKGNVTDDLRIQRDRYSSSGFRVHGLQEMGYRTRLEHASQLLRQNGVETEKIEEIIKPHELVIDGERLPMEDVKKRLVEELRTRIAKNEEREGMLSAQKPLTEQDLPAVEKYIQDAEFIFTVRSLQTTERMRDLEEVQSEEQFHQMMERVLRFVNIREEIEAKREGREARHFDAQNSEDTRSYLAEYLPARLGQNLAKIHNLDLFHGFPTSQNSSMAGGYYDLDSIQGVFPVDREFVTKEEIRDDLSMSVSGLLETNQKTMRDVVDENTDRKRNWYKNEVGEKISDEALANFISSYLRTIDIRKFTDTDFEKYSHDYLADLLSDVSKQVASGELNAEQIRVELERMRGAGEDLAKEARGFYISTMEREISDMVCTFVKRSPVGARQTSQAETVIKTEVSKYVGEVAEREVSRVNFSHDQIVAAILDKLGLKASM